MSYMYDGQMSNEVVMTIDSDPLVTQSFSIARARNSKSNQENNHQEVVTIYENQILTFSGSMLFDNSAAAVKLLNNIKTLDSGINTEYALAITYPAISATPDTYIVSLGSGNISINEGGVITLNFVLTLAEV